ncbi:MAG: NAD-glutamate dehydrogenase, partial [Nocardiopsis sp. BM-2018]
MLRNNYLQSLAISLALDRGTNDLGHQERLMEALEDRGLLDREVEELPSTQEIVDRQKEGRCLTRAEIGVLL